MHKHRWQLEPATQSRLAMDGEVDGELYTRRCTQGNIRGECKCGATRVFRPNTAA